MTRNNLCIISVSLETAFHFRLNECLTFFLQKYLCTLRHLLARQNQPSFDSERQSHVCKLYPSQTFKVNFLFFYPNSFDVNDLLRKATQKNEKYFYVTIYFLSQIINLL